MKTIAQANEDQAAYWNGVGGERWVRGQRRTDTMLAPVSAALLERAGVQAGMTVLDVGCGCGATPLDLARAVGPSGAVIALDVSQPMLAIAEARLTGFENVQLVCADAGVYCFTPTADRMISRFGVMFFGDPVAAFANIRTALKPQGRVFFACWRDIRENPWMHVPLHAVYKHVPRIPKPDPNDPGPFSFADTSRVENILTASGFTRPSFTPVDVWLDIAGEDGFEAAVEQATTIGAAAHALRDQPEDLQRLAVQELREALRPYSIGKSVALPGAIWIVECGVSEGAGE